MGRYALKVTAVMIVTYIVAANATQWGKLLLNAGSAGSGVAKTLQGR